MEGGDPLIIHVPGGGSNFRKKVDTAFDKFSSSQQTSNKRTIQQRIIPISR
jgi:hypothetical protein